MKKLLSALLLSSALPVVAAIFYPRCLAQECAGRGLVIQLRLMYRLADRF